MEKDKLPNVIETYLMEEVTELLYQDDKLDEWKKLTAELKLSGQASTTQPEKSPVPFIPMKRNLENVFSTLCPVHVEIGNYDISPIPLEILKLISMSVKEKYFQKIEIWYDEKELDPLAIGIIGYWRELSWYDDSNKEIKNQEFKTKQAVLDAGGKHPEFHYKQKYLIGRWGDVKQSFKQLSERAIERYMSQEKVLYERQIKDAERKIEDLKNNAIEMFTI